MRTKTFDEYTDLCVVKEKESCGKVVEVVDCVRWVRCPYTKKD